MTATVDFCERRALLPDAERYRLRQAELMLAAFAAANGRQAQTHVELEEWVAANPGMRFRPEGPA